MNITPLTLGVQVQVALERAKKGWSLKLAASEADLAKDEVPVIAGTWDGILRLYRIFDLEAGAYRAFVAGETIWAQARFQEAADFVQSAIDRTIIVAAAPTAQPTTDPVTARVVGNSLHLTRPDADLDDLHDTVDAVYSGNGAAGIVDAIPVVVPKGQTLKIPWAAALVPYVEGCWRSNDAAQAATPMKVITPLPPTRPVLGAMTPTAEVSTTVTTDYTLSRGPLPLNATGYEYRVGTTGAWTPETAETVALAGTAGATITLQVRATAPGYTAGPIGTATVTLGTSRRTWRLSDISSQHRGGEVQLFSSDPYPVPASHTIQAQFSETSAGLESSPIWAASRGDRSLNAHFPRGQTVYSRARLRLADNTLEDWSDMLSFAIPGTPQAVIPKPANPTLSLAVVRDRFGNLVRRLVVTLPDTGTDSRALVVIRSNISSVGNIVRPANFLSSSLSSYNAIVAPNRGETYNVKIAAVRSSTGGFVDRSRVVDYGPWSDWVSIRRR